MKATLKESAEHQILERILSLKQMMQDGRGGPLELHELGVCYYLLENFSVSSGFLRDLSEKYPDYLEIGAATALRTYCLIQEGDMLEAELLLKERIPKDPTNSSLLGMLAHVQEKTARVKEALETHKKILKTDPDNINSLNSIGYLLAKHGDDKDLSLAFESLKAAITKKPDHPAYLDSLGVLLARKGEKDRARKAFLKALGRAPGNAEIMEHMKSIL